MSPPDLDEVVAAVHGEEGEHDTGLVKDSTDRDDWVEVSSGS